MIKKNLHVSVKQPFTEAQIYHCIFFSNLHRLGEKCESIDDPWWLTALACARHFYLSCNYRECDCYWQEFARRTVYRDRAVSKYTGHGHNGVRAFVPSVLQARLLVPSPSFLPLFRSCMQSRFDTVGSRWPAIYTTARSYVSREAMYVHASVCVWYVCVCIRCCKYACKSTRGTDATTSIRIDRQH